MRETFNPSRRPLLRRGFTLIEILVVLTIILIIAVAAVPAVRFIIGSRSLEGAQNVAGGMLGRARTSAVVEHQVRGVFFFLDPVSDRTTMALVKQEGDSTPNPDLDAYKAWTDGQDQVPRPLLPPVKVTYNDATNPQIGPSFANVMTNFSGEVFNLGGGKVQKPTLEMFKCILTNTANVNSNAPPNATYWNTANPLYLEIVDNTDFQILPAGVGVQLMNDPLGNASNDRYLRTGVILFDSNGLFSSVNYDVKASSRLGKAIGLTAKDLDGATNPKVPKSPFFSQFGLVLYDRETLKAASGFQFSEGDTMTSGVLPNPPATPGDEQNEEKWLDTNSLPLLLNRYNGTLIKGE